uniref:Tripartite motif containing 27 n=1 Tax=Oryctolagus cuniculus TaxID=9986 RepID=A0A5F9DP58_RABIT
QGSLTGSIPNPVKTLQEEAVCAICLDYFTDPVSIRCGHNFCRVCITQLWFSGHAGGAPQCFTCPQCRKSFHRWSFRPNLQLANMVQVIRQMHPNPAQGSHVNEQAMCPKHQEALTLFCKVDEEAICVVCRESRRHKQHSVVPVEEVVQGYKAKLQGHLEPLRKHLGELQDMKAEEERRLAELNSQMDLELAGAASEFGQLTEFLEEEQAHLQWLIQEMYKAKMGRARANVNHFSEQFTKLSGLLAEVQERSQQGGLLLLQETLKKCQEVLQQPPKIFPPEISQPLGDDFRTDAIVRKMSRVFCKDTRVNLKPDPDAAPLAPNLSTDSCDPPGGEAAGGF